MNKVSNPKVLQILTKLLILTALAKLLSMLLLWYLPANGVDLKSKKNYSPPYQRVNFSNMLTAAKSVQQNSQNKQTQNNTASINDMSLIGLYGAGNHGYAIVAMKSNLKKTAIVGVGETYNGYMLKSIHKDNVIFTKNKKDYILHFKEQKHKNFNITHMNDQSSDESIVSRKDIRFFEKNPQKIWKQIAIDEVIENGKIKGFKIKRINKNSKFAKLGLKKGDVIIRANNIDLTSYKSVMDIYRNINKLDELSLVFLRNNEEKELVYEIH